MNTVQEVIYYAWQSAMATVAGGVIIFMFVFCCAAAILMFKELFNGQ